MNYYEKWNDYIMESKYGPGESDNEMMNCF